MREDGLREEPPERPGCRLHRDGEPPAFPADPAVCERAWASVPYSDLGASAQYESMPGQGLPGVQLTVNSQSTHSQLDSQLTVNSTVNSTVNGTAKSWTYITNFGKQRPPGPPENSFNLIKIIKRGRSSQPSSLSGLMTTPCLQFRNVNPGFGCPVDR